MGIFKKVKENNLQEVSIIERTRSCLKFGLENTSWGNENISLYFQQPETKQSENDREKRRKKETLYVAVTHAEITNRGGT